MMNALERLIQSATELGTARTLEALGVHSGEISHRRARDIYGKWFTDAAAAGRVRPVRVDSGRNGTRWFSVVDILSLKVYDAARVELIDTTFNHHKAI